MPLVRRSFSVAGLSLVGLAVGFAACTNDSTSVDPEPPVVAPPTVPSGMFLVECRADLTRREVSCGDPASGGGASALILGNLSYMRMPTTNLQVLGTDTFAFDLSVQNLLRQPVDGRKQNFGTTDGTTLHPAGVRVFFHTGPVPVPAGTGTVTVANPTGWGFFTASNQAYFQYNEVLDSGMVSAPYPEQWKLHFQGGADRATWLLYVSTEVPLPTGWVDILPESTSVHVDRSATVTATVRRHVGSVLGGSVTFTSSNPAIASIHPTTGVITGKAIGQTTITATQDTRTGTAVVTVPSKVTPDSISALENVTTAVDSANGLLPNVADAEMAASVVPGTFATPEGGIVRIYANGSYDYLNEVGFTGKDTIHFQVSDGGNTEDGVVVVQVVPSNYIYVKQGAAGTTDGRDRFPFASLADAQAVAGTGDSIFVLYAGATQLEGPLVMEDGQALIGQGIPADISTTLNGTAVIILADSAAPGITRSTSGATVTLATNNTIAGIGLASANGAAISGTSFGTLTTHSLAVGATGRAALDLTTGALAGTFTTLSSTNSATRGLYLVSVNGKLNATGGSITGAAASAVQVVGGSVDVSYGGNVTQGNPAPLLTVAGGHTGTLAFTGTLSATAGTGLQFSDADGTYDHFGTVTLNGGDAGIDVTNNSSGTFSFLNTANITSPNAGNLITIQNSTANFNYAGGFTKTNNGIGGILISGNSGGTIAFTGDGTTLDSDPAEVAKSISSGNAAGVSMSSNTGTTINFNGGGLAITSGSGHGFTATGGGAVQLTGAGNTVNATGGGTAVNIQNTSIGPSGLTLRSVGASGGGGGIVLQSTGSNGLQVTGSGTHGSGGTVVNSTGADGAVAGNGVYLSNAANVSLRWMNLSGHANHAIRGTSVSNVTLKRLRITGTNGTTTRNRTVLFDEGSVSFTNLTGSAAIDSSYIQGGFTNNVRVHNTTGTLDRLTMTRDTIGHNGSTGEEGVLLNAYGTARLNATLQNSRFTGSRGTSVQYVVRSDARGDFVFSSNTLTNNHANKSSAGGLGVSHASNAAVTYTVAGNSVRESIIGGIEVARDGFGSGAMTGSITGNTVGVAGVANSGGAHTILVELIGGGTTATHTTTITGNTLRQYRGAGISLHNLGTGNGYLNASVKTNNIAQPSSGAHSGIFVVSGGQSAADNGRTCLDVKGNTLNQTSISDSELMVTGFTLARISLLGLGQGGASSNPNTFLRNQNTITVAPGATAVNATSTKPFQGSCPPV